MPIAILPRAAIYGYTLCVDRALLLALTLFAAPARAQSVPKLILVGTATRSGYEELSILGWAGGCSVGMQYLRYPPEGQGMSGVPDAWRLGTVALPPDAAEQVETWSYTSSHGHGYAREDMAAAAAVLKDAGRHDRRGTVERLRYGRVADQPGLEGLLMSTAVFKTDPPLGGFPERFRFSEVHYSPLGSCALFLFQDIRSPRDGYRTKLVRLPEPGVRRVRARAHVTNALLLYRNDADITGAEAELAVASAMDPGYPLARYHHAVLLTLHGRFEEAIESLKVALKRDPSWAAEARRAGEFEPLQGDPRFKAILAAAAAAPPRPPRGTPGPKTEQPAPTRRSGQPDRRHY